MKQLLIPIITLLILSCNDKISTKGNELGEHLNQIVPEMEIVELPESRVVLKEVIGDFSKHPVEIEKLQSFLKSKGIKGGKCLGIYPDDPDGVHTSNLNWKIAFEVPLNQGALDSDEYTLTTIKGGTALVVKSNVKNSATHGLYCKVWLLEHNFVQTESTRMIYHFDSNIPEDQSTTIIFPVIKRARNIPVITASTIHHKIRE